MWIFFKFFCHTYFCWGRQCARKWAPDWKPLCMVVNIAVYPSAFPPIFTLICTYYLVDAIQLNSFLPIWDLHPYWKFRKRSPICKLFVFPRYCIDVVVSRNSVCCCLSKVVIRINSLGIERTRFSCADYVFASSLRPQPARSCWIQGIIIFHNRYICIFDIPASPQSL